MRHRALTLEELRDWYEERAHDYAYTREERELWQRLADELRLRIGPPKSESEAAQEPLW